MNLTALPLEDPTDETFDRLLVEPLAAAPYVADSALTWFDLGSGGGSPAIPLKILRTRAKLTMVEAKARKAAFLREAVRAVGLEGVVVENARFEELGSDLEGKAKLVTIRAVRGDAVVFDSATKLLSRGGQLFWFGADADRASQIGGFSVITSVNLLGMPASTLSVLEPTFHVEQKG